MLKQSFQKRVKLVVRREWHCLSILKSAQYIVLLTAVNWSHLLHWSQQKLFDASCLKHHWSVIERVISSQRLQNTWQTSPSGWVRGKNLPDRRVSQATAVASNLSQMWAGQNLEQEAGSPAPCSNHHTAFFDAFLTTTASKNHPSKAFLGSNKWTIQT